MDNQQEDNKDLEPTTQPDVILESTEKAQQDDENDSEPETQQEVVAQETQENKHDECKPTIPEMSALNCLQNIFALLTIRDLVRSERVCHAWRDFVLQYLPFVQNYRISYCNESPCKVPDRDLSFRPITLSMRKGEIIKMINKMGKYFVRVYSDCIDEEDSKALAVHCPHLEYLLLSGTHIKLIFDDESEEESERRKFTGVFLTDLRTNLKILGLSFFKLFKVEYLQAAVHRLTHLTRLDLNSISVETLQSVSTLLEQMPLLEHLSLMEYERGREAGIDPPCFDRLFRLRELHLWGNEFVTDSWVEAATNCESLRVLNVGTCYEVRMRVVVELCHKRRQLTELVVAKLRVTNTDLEHCVAFCRNLELLDVSWCTRLTPHFLTHISRPNIRPLVVRLHGTRILEGNAIYEGLTLRWDLASELYNPLQVRYLNRGITAEYVVLEHAIATELPDIHVEDAIPMVVDAVTEGNALAENAMDAEGAVGADDAIQAECDLRTEDVAPAEHDIHEEDNIRAEDDVQMEEVAGNNIPVEVAIDAVDAIRAGDVRAENVLREENARHVVDDRYLPIERRVVDDVRVDDNIRPENDLRIDIPEEEIRNPVNFLDFPEEEEIRNPIMNFLNLNRPARDIYHAIAIIHEENLLRQNGDIMENLVNGVRENFPVDLEDGDEPVNGDEPEYAEIPDNHDPRDNSDSDEYEEIPAAPVLNGFNPEDDIYPEEDVLLDNRVDMNPPRVPEVQVPIPVEVRNIEFEIDGINPMGGDEIRFYPIRDVDQRRGAVAERGLYPDDVLFAQDEPNEDYDNDSDD